MLPGDVVHAVIQKLRIHSSVQSIPLHGANMGALGADASSNVGAWMLDSVPPGEHCTPAREHPGEAMQTEATPYSRTETTPHRLTLTFATGSARLADDELARLQTFVGTLAAMWMREP